MRPQLRIESRLSGRPHTVRTGLRGEQCRERVSKKFLVRCQVEIQDCSPAMSSHRASPRAVVEGHDAGSSLGSELRWESSWSDASERTIRDHRSRLNGIHSRFLEPSLSCHRLRRTNSGALPGSSGLSSGSGIGRYSAAIKSLAPPVSSSRRVGSKRSRFVPCSNDPDCLDVRSMIASQAWTTCCSRYSRTP